MIGALYLRYAQSVALLHRAVLQLLRVAPSLTLRPVVATVAVVACCAVAVRERCNLRVAWIVCNGELVSNCFEESAMFEAVVHFMTWAMLGLAGWAVYDTCRNYFRR